MKLRFEIHKTTSYPDSTREIIEQKLGQVTKMSLNASEIAVLSEYEYGEKERAPQYGQYAFVGECEAHKALELVATLPQGAVEASELFRFQRIAINLDHAAILNRSTAEIMNILHGIKQGAYDKQYAGDALAGGTC